MGSLTLGDELLRVEGAGSDLGTLTAAGLAVLRLDDALRGLVKVYPGVEREDEMVAAFEFCTFGKGGAAPPIDTAMHGLVEAAHVSCEVGLKQAHRPPGRRMGRPLIFLKPGLGRHDRLAELAEQHGTAGRLRRPDVGAG
jgi:hypothetical protein